MTRRAAATSTAFAADVGASATATGCWTTRPSFHLTVSFLLSNPDSNPD